MAGQRNDPDSYDQLFIAAGVIVGVIVLWWLFRNDIAQAALFVSYYETAAISHVPVYGRRWASLLAAIPHIDPNRMGVWGVVRLLHDAGSAWRIPFAGFTFLLAYAIRRKAFSQRFTDSLNFRSMVKIQSRNFPVILPAVRSRLKETARDTGPWRRSELPYEWALRNEALEPPADMPEDQEYDYRALLAFYKGAKYDIPIQSFPRVNTRRARRAFVAEMRPWRGIDSLSEPRKALIAALALWIQGDYLDERYATAGGNRLLAHYNKTFVYFDLQGPAFLRLLAARFGRCESFLTKKGWLKEVPRPRFDATPAFDVLQRDDVRALIDEFASKHGFEEGVFLAMMEACNDLMILPVQNFLWLKPIDRTLFYVLDSLGRNGAWSEGGGAVAHYREELFNERRLKDPQVNLAVDALVKELTDHGWITDDPV